MVKSRMEKYKMPPKIDNIFGVTPQIKTSKNTTAQKTNTVQTFNHTPTEADKMRGLQVERTQDELEILKRELDEMYPLWGWKFSSREEFEKAYYSMLDDCRKNGGYVFERMQQLQPNGPVSAEWIRENCAWGGLTLPTSPLPDIDWSQSRESFAYIKYYEDTFSGTSMNHFPDGYNPQTVFENGKKLGLGLDEVHEMGYTGKGCSVAVIDGVLDTNHNDFKVKSNTVSGFAQNEPSSFHASACVGLLGGKTTGVAPDADIYYFATSSKSHEAHISSQTDMLKNILEINKTKPDNEKIRVVSISASVGQDAETQKVLEELRNSGVWVLSANEFRENFGYLTKKDPMKSPDDYENYQICNWNDNNGKENRDALFVNSGDRTVPAPENGENSFRHDAQASQSWAIPVIAGYYALACQADPSMTPDRFIKLAHQTAYQAQSPVPQVSGDPKKPTITYSKETVPIKIIDINALIKEIEAQKAKN